MPAGPNLEVDVVRAPHVEARENRLKYDEPFSIGKLNPAKKSKFVGRVILRRQTHSLHALRRTRTIAGVLRIESGRRTRRTASRTTWATRTHRTHLREPRVESERIAMPDIHGYVGERLAGARVHYG